MDYVKLRIEGVDIDELIQNSKLNFKYDLSKKTGEIENKGVAVHHHCLIYAFDSGRIIFQGSIHKMYNSLKRITPPNYLRLKKSGKYNGFNGNKFYLSQISFINDYLCNLFKCESDKIFFENIEIGFNCNVSFEPQIFLTGLLLHRGNQIEPNHNRRFFEVIHNDFCLKFYDKSFQFKMESKIIRCEIRIKRMSHIHTLGVYTLKDINTKTLKLLAKLFLKKIDKLIYFDKTIDKDKLTKNELDFIQKCNNIDFWFDLEPERRDRPKKRLNKIILNKSENLRLQIKQEILRQLIIINSN